MRSRLQWIPALLVACMVGAAAVIPNLDGGPVGGPSSLACVATPGHDDAHGHRDHLGAFEIVNGRLKLVDSDLVPPLAIVAARREEVGPGAALGRPLRSLDSIAAHAARGPPAA